jgi:hypothetical protein
MSPDYSKESLMKFLDHIISKDLVKPETGRSWRVAVSKMLVDLSPAEESDVRKIDMEVLTHKFANRNTRTGTYTPQSLNVYRSRVTSAIQEFVTYVDDPIEYKPRVFRGKTRKKETTNQRQSGKQIAHASSPLSNGNTEIRDMPSASVGLTHQFPVRADFLAQVVVPRDLTVHEAKRLGAWLLTLAVDYMPSESGQN